MSVGSGCPEVLDPLRTLQLRCGPFVVVWPEFSPQNSWSPDVSNFEVRLTVRTVECDSLCAITMHIKLTLELRLSVCEVDGHQ